MRKYQLIASGTFDFLHKGHKSFLEKSLELSDEVIVCITSDFYVQSFKNLKGIEDFEVRKNAVVQFLISIGAINKTKIIPIDDIYGPLLTNKYNPQGIAVTPENEINAIKINSERVKKDLSKLEIKVIAMDLAEDGGIISSTRIRNGGINRNGRLYVRPDWENKTLNLPKELRPVLQKPLGKLLKSIPSGLDPEKTITIGDIATQKFNEKKVGQFLSIIDFAVRREKKFNKLSDLGFLGDIETIETKNPAGSITPQLFDSVRKALQTSKQKVVLVKGEEDLAVLPAMLVAPLGFVIFYGQPDEGLVEVGVTEENKEKVYKLVSKFT